MNKIKLILLVAIIFISCTNSSEARPERVKEGISYYSEDYISKDDVSDIAEEKNYEEVFKNYEYYEAVYDDKKRIKIFRSYKRGELVSKEEYFYASDGGLTKKEVTDSKNNIKTITFGK